MRSATTRASTNLFALVISLGLGACSGDSFKLDNSQQFLPIAEATVEQPPAVGSAFLQSVSFDLATVGYRQDEYFLAGVASAFTNLNELATDGLWQVEPAETADFRTRVIVYRPLDPAAFSGTVIVEWLNVTAGFELGPSLNAGRTGMLRAGHAWVGVSAQRIGIEGSPSSLLPLYLKAVNPGRYGGLLHPGDSFSYDIFSQVAQAIRQPGQLDILDGLQAERLLAFGESQSAGRMVTYLNAVHPLYNTFDGYMVHSRGDGSSALAQDPQVLIATPEQVTVRTDLNVPVMTFQTETDLFYLGYVASRQPDSERFRLWEVAGTAHGDNYTSVVGFDDDGSDPAFAVVVENDQIGGGLLTCDLPLNNGPQPWVFNAAIDALERWVIDGTPPPSADRLAVNDDSTGFQFDATGNVLGGIRTPYVDAPAAILSGEGQLGGSFCFLFGTTELLDAAQMASRYVDRAGYVQAVTDATDDAVAKGFLLAPDALRIKAAAGLQWDALGI